MSGTISPAILSLLVEYSVLELQDFSKAMNKADGFAVKSLAVLALTPIMAVFFPCVVTVKYIFAHEQVFGNQCCCNTDTTNIQSFRKDAGISKGIFPKCIHTAWL